MAGGSKGLVPVIPTFDFCSVTLAAGRGLNHASQLCKLFWRQREIMTQNGENSDANYMACPHVDAGLTSAKPPDNTARHGASRVFWCGNFCISFFASRPSRTVFFARQSQLQSACPLPGYVLDRPEWT
jgi:hypothetical protein